MKLHRERILVAVTLGVMFIALGFTVLSWQFWCLVGACWALDLVSWEQGRQQGRVEMLAELQQAGLNRQALQQIAQHIKDHND